MSKWITLFALFLVSLFAVALVGMRALYSGRALYFFLLWNLFLAWLPMLFAWLAVSWRRWPLLALAMAPLWLLFFPNAPYMATDLLHLREIAPVPLWYDMILLLTFALLGLFLGFVSLRMMQGLISGYFGPVMGWLFALAAMGAGALGVFIGRFLRWNSWDLFTRPSVLLNDILSSLMEPKTVVATGLLTMLFLFAYLIFAIAPQITAGLQQDVTNQSSTF
jgi:uncharacterized membrane protein